MSQFKQNNEKEIEDLRTKIKELEMKNANQKFTIGELQRDKKTESIRNCPDCSAKPGHCHSEGCDVQRCSVCGGQRLLCTCEGHDPAFSRWSGMWPGTAEAIALGVDLNEFALKYDRIFNIKPKMSRNGEILPDLCVRDTCHFYKRTKILQEIANENNAVISKLNKKVHELETFASSDHTTIRSLRDKLTELNQQIGSLETTNADYARVCKNHAKELEELLDEKDHQIVLLKDKVEYIEKKNSELIKITNSYGLSNALTGMAKHEGWMTDDQWLIGKNDDGSVYCCANEERQIMLPGALVDRIRANYESEEIDKLQRDARNFEDKVKSLRDEIHQLNHKNEDLVLEKEKLAREKALAEKKYRDRAARTLKLSRDRDEWKASAESFKIELKKTMEEDVEKSSKLFNQIAFLEKELKELNEFKGSHEVVDCDNCNRILELEKNIAKAQTARAKNVRETQAKVIKLENKVMLFKGRVGTVENYLKNSNAHVEDLKVQLDVARTTIKLVHQVTEEVAQK